MLGLRDVCAFLRALKAQLALMIALVQRTKFGCSVVPLKGSPDPAFKARLGCHRPIV